MKYPVYMQGKRLPDSIVVGRIVEFKKQTPTRAAKFYDLKGKKHILNKDELSLVKSRMEEQAELYASRMRDRIGILTKYFDEHGVRITYNNNGILDEKLFRLGKDAQKWIRVSVYGILPIIGGIVLDALNITSPAIERAVIVGSIVLTSIPFVTAIVDQIRAENLREEIDYAKKYVLYSDCNNDFYDAARVRSIAAQISCGRSRENISAQNLDNYSFSQVADEYRQVCLDLESFGNQMPDQMPYRTNSGYEPKASEIPFNDNRCEVGEFIIPQDLMEQTEEVRIGDPEQPASPIRMLIKRLEG